MLNASMFTFGTNDFGVPLCSEDKCECYCETSSKAGVCNQKDNKGFRLYKFVQKGNFQIIQVALRLFVLLVIITINFKFYQIMHKSIYLGVNCGSNSVAKDCNGDCMWSNNKCIHLNVTKGMYYDQINKD